MCLFSVGCIICLHSYIPWGYSIAGMVNTSVMVVGLNNIGCASDKESLSHMSSGRVWAAGIILEVVARKRPQTGTSRAPCAVFEGSPNRAADEASKNKH